MTSPGNSINNIIATESVYRHEEITNEFIGAVILGDDNLSIFKGKPPQGL